MISERLLFLVSLDRRLATVDADLGFIEDAAATLDVPFEFGETRRLLSELRALVKKDLLDG